MEDLIDKKMIPKVRSVHQVKMDIHRKKRQIVRATRQISHLKRHINTNLPRMFSVLPKDDGEALEFCKMLKRLGVVEGKIPNSKNLLTFEVLEENEEKESSPLK